MRTQQQGPARRPRGARPRAGEQLCLEFPNGWGGRRKGAGRRRVKSRSEVPHRTRPVHRAAEPVHVTLRVAIRSLRAQFVYPTVAGAVGDTNRAREDSFRIVQYSVQADHLHLLVQASSTDCLVSGMRSFSARLVRRVNRLLFRRGRLLPERWHGRALSTPRAVRRALVYVLANFKSTASERLCRSIPARQRRTSRTSRSSRGSRHSSPIRPSFPTPSVPAHRPLPAPNRGSSASDGLATDSFRSEKHHSPEAHDRQFVFLEIEDGIAPKQVLRIEHMQSTIRATRSARAATRLSNARPCCIPHPRHSG